MGLTGWIVALVACAVPPPPASVATVSQPSGEPEPIVAPPREPELVLRTPSPIPELPAGDLIARDPSAPAGLHEVWAAMHEIGFPDVSGLPYHEVVITGGDAWSSEPEPVRTHAWLYRWHDDRVAWVVTWDGLLYPTMQVGARADLAADVRWVARATARDGYERPVREGFRSFEIGLGTVLLYGLGRVDLVHDLRRVLGERFVLDPGRLAVEWIWTRCERLLAAFEFGDDTLALADSRWLAAAREIIVAHGAPRRFLETLDTTLSDLERRAQEPSRERLVWDPNAEGPSDPLPSISALLDELDEIHLVEPGALTYADFRSSIVVRALAAHGEAAIEPLLTALLADERLTRTFYRGHFVFARLPRRVSEAIYAALEMIVRPNFDAGAAYPRVVWWTAAERAGLADRVRSFIARFGPVPGPTRSLLMLSADELGPSGWAGPASELVARPSAASDAGPLAGEVLRGQRGSEITALLARRLRQSFEPAEREPACALASALHAWSPEDSQRALSEFARECVVPDDVCPCATELTLMLGHARDARVFGLYRRWLPASDVSSENAEDYARPLFEFADHPDMIAAARWLASPGADVLPGVDSGARLGDATIEGRLFELAPVRERIREQLADERAFGTLYRDGDEVVFERGTDSVRWRDADAFHVNAVRSIVRVCDFYAWRIAAIPGAPAFSLAWREPRRAEAIRALRQWLTAYRPLPRGH